MLTKEESERWQKNGAEARARGEDQFSCELYKSENMPRATGEPLKLYQAKIEAWRFGWTMEDLLRSK